MIASEIRRQFLAELDHSSPETQRTRLFWCEKFLQFATNKPLSEWNKSLVYSFEQRLRDEKYAGLTVRTALGVVKRVFDAAKIVHEQQRRELLTGVDIKDPESAVMALARIQQFDSTPGPVWDLGKRAMPRVEANQITKPALTLDEIEKMVKAARSGALELPEICYLALSSIYGLRRGELGAVRREHFDFSDNTLFVMTEKGGEKRRQLLADPIIDYLKRYDFQRSYSPFEMSYLFKRICFKCGVENRDGGGWHQARRYLDTALVDEFGELKAHIFLRWKLSSSSAMELRYYTPPSLLEVDREILENGHPVVPLWR